MIISHKYRYIFLHCRKVAGSSITVYLNRSLGFRDIQLGSWRDTVALGGRFNARLFYDVLRHNTRAHLPLVLRDMGRLYRAVDKADVGHSIGRMQKINYREWLHEAAEHTGAKFIRDHFPDAWKNYYKFCFVRNPWDRAVSDYKWRTRKKKRSQISFVEFLERINDPLRPDPEEVVPLPATNWSLYTIEDRMAVDYVGRFENLYADMQHVCEQIGLAFDPSCFPHAKKLRDNTDYREWYNEYTKHLVAEANRHEIATFGYTF
jgi:hypothetical protein